MDECFASGSPVYVLHFPESVPLEDATWVLDKMLTGDDGIEEEEDPPGLIMSCVPPKTGSGLTMIVSMTKERRRVLATELRLTKTNLKGRSKKFRLDKMDSFCVDGDDSQLFTSAETLMMIRYQMDNIRSNRYQHMPTLDVIFYRGESIMDKLLCLDMVVMHPLHQKDQLNKIADDWYGSHCKLHSILKQPLDSIRNYWGESEGFFFAFLQSLTVAMAFPAALGLLQAIWWPVDVVTRLVFTSLYLLWAFGLMEHWKRRSCVLSYQWGTNLKSDSYQRYGVPRPNYRGKLLTNPVTGHLEPYYPAWKTYVKVYCVSVPLVVLSLVVSYMLLLESIRNQVGLEDKIRTQVHPKLVRTLPLLGRLPTLLYSAFVWLANNCYRRLSHRLTEWENHRTQRDFDKHRLIKILLFEVLNNFLSPFYIAFVLKDLQLLKKQVNTMLFMSLGLRKWVGTFTPNLKMLLTFHQPFCQPDKEMEKLLKELDITMLDTTHPMVLQVMEDYREDNYVGVNEDYLALFVKFGFTLLFVVISPLSLLAFMMSNIVEWRVISYNLTRLCRRTPVSRTGNIGAWVLAFRSLIYLAVLTNVGLVYITAQHHGEDEALICVIVSQLLLIAQQVLKQAVPSIPNSIKVAMAQDETHLIQPKSSKHKEE